MSLAIYPCWANITTKNYEPVDGFDIEDAVTIPSFFPKTGSYMSYAAFTDWLQAILRSAAEQHYVGTETPAYIAVKCARLLDLQKQAKMLGASGFYVA